MKKRIWSMMLVLVILINTLHTTVLAVPDVTSSNSINPRTEDSFITFVKLGSYPQTEVEETEILIQAHYDDNGDTSVDGVRFRRITTNDGLHRYFRWEPIIWQLIGNVLITVNVIDSKKYDNQKSKYDYSYGGIPIRYCDATSWNDSSLNQFLNESFMFQAFTETERKNLSSEVSLLSEEIAKEFLTTPNSYAYLCKHSTDYAETVGVISKPTEYYRGDCSWWLKRDYNSGHAQIITAEGTLGIGQGEILNEDGIGLVPCIEIHDLDNLELWTEPVPVEEVMVYYPGGRMQYVTPQEANNLVSNGWYLSVEDAQSASLTNMEQKYATSHFADLYEWSLDKKNGCITVNPPKANMTTQEVLELVLPFVNTFFTGNPDDFIKIYITLNYTEDAIPSGEIFSDTLGHQIHDALSSCLSGNSVMLSSADRKTGTTICGNDKTYSIFIELPINGNGKYDARTNIYYDKLFKLVADAKNYSDRPLGQIQYLRYWLGQNTVYSGNHINNHPYFLLIDGKGVCASYASLVCDFCKMIGIPCMRLSCDQPNHAWNAVYLEDKWYQIDTTGYMKEETMSIVFSHYQVDGKQFKFNPEGFPDEHKAEDVDFLFENHHFLEDHTFGEKKCCCMSSENFLYAQKLLSNSSLTAPPPYLVAPTPTPSPEAPFTDVAATDYFAAPVQWAVDNNITGGLGEGIFGPNNSCTRGQVVTFLWAANGKPEPNTTVNPFNDVSESDYYYKAVLWAVENNITGGVGEGLFGPNATCTRGQIVTFLWAANGKPAVEGESSFTDVTASDWFLNPVLWAAENNVTGGIGEGMFGPNNTCTRGQVVTFLYKVYNK